MSTMPVVEIRSVRRKQPSDRKFGFTIAAVLVVYAVWSYVRHDRLLNGLLAAAAIVALLAALFPRLLRWPNLAWQRLGHLLERIVSPIILAAVFVLVMTPIAVIMRLARRDPLRRRLDRGADSYWIARESQPAAESWTQQF